MELYRIVPPLGDNIPIPLTPAHIDDSVPTEEEVDWAVQRLRGHRLGFLSWMRNEHLWEWFREHLAGEAAIEADTTSDPEGR